MKARVEELEQFGGCFFPWIASAHLWYLPDGNFVLTKIGDLSL